MASQFPGEPEVDKYTNACKLVMKRRELERRPKFLGWETRRSGRRHDIWRRGCHDIAVPRHDEINELTARAILRVAGEMRE
jgi:hypothetical protein